MIVFLNVLDNKIKNLLYILRNKIIAILLIIYLTDIYFKIQSLWNIIQTLSFTKIEWLIKLVKRTFRTKF